MKVDYLGILLIALGFACLEVVAFFAIAIVALVAALVWELRQQDPVVELRLLGERNFALANALYFLCLRKTRFALSRLLLARYINKLVGDDPVLVSALCDCLRQYIYPQAIGKSTTHSTAYFRID